MRSDLRVIAVAGCLLTAAIITGCGSDRGGLASNGSAGDSASRPAAQRSAPAALGTLIAPRSSVVQSAVREVADPEESRSYPATGAIHHARAATPASAGEAAVAPGAASDAEVRAELELLNEVGRSTTKTELTTPVPGGQSIGGNGKIPIPKDVPEAVQKVIAGANEIADFPYVYGGGHASFVDNAYDCSGSVSYALAAGGLLSAPEVSGELEHWGAPGPGKYITVYADAGHTYMYIDGVLYDTAGRSGVYASRWLVGGTDNSGYVVRHWPGL
jgi:cell wall-associated NlpC family hydrolase